MHTDQYAAALTRHATSILLGVETNDGNKRRAEQRRVKLVAEREDAL